MKEKIKSNAYALYLIVLIVLFIVVYCFNATASDADLFVPFSQEVYQEYVDFPTDTEEGYFDRVMHKLERWAFLSYFAIGSAVENVDEVVDNALSVIDLEPSDFLYNLSTGDLVVSASGRSKFLNYYNDNAFESGNNGWVQYQAGDTVSYLEYGTVPNVRIINFTRQSNNGGPFVGSYYTFITDNSGTTQGSSGAGKGLAMIWVNPTWRTPPINSWDYYYATWYYTEYTGGTTSEYVVSASAPAVRDTSGDYHLCYTLGKSISPTSASAIYATKEEALYAFYHGGSSDPELNGLLYYNTDLTYNPVTKPRVPTVNPIRINSNERDQDEVNRIIRTNSPQSSPVIYTYNYKDLATDVQQPLVILKTDVPDISDIEYLLPDYGVPTSYGFLNDTYNILPDGVVALIVISLTLALGGLLIRG